MDISKLHFINKDEPLLFCLDFAELEFEKFGVHH